MKSENYLFTTSSATFITYGYSMFPTIIFPTFLFELYEFSEVIKEMTYIEFVERSEVVLYKAPGPYGEHEEYHPRVAVYIGDRQIGVFIMYEIRVSQLMRIALKATAWGCKVVL